MIPLVDRAAAHAGRRALIAADGTWGYAQLLAASARVAGGLLDGQDDLAEARVAFLVAPSAAHVAAQWGIWRAGGIAVPLCTSHPAPELAYAIDEARATTLVADDVHHPRLAPLAAERGLRLLHTASLLAVPAGSLPDVAPERRAMILFTSGTTSKPKGVVTTHAGLAAQIAAVVEAWEWSADDHILHVLPLHHLHGILNLLCVALWSGATCELEDGFDAARVWQRIAAADGLTLFMAVPTIYARLRTAWESASLAERAAMSAGCRRLRLMVSGSAALPVALLDAWRAISGHTLLERYGMTEIGMGLGNPLHGQRRPGHVGVPFPGVEVRLVDDAGMTVGDDTPGQIQVRGPGVFREYWQRPAETRAAFTADGWFKTGDVAVREHGSYRILGRDSIDIIKTGGFKVSALEIEEVLREHPAIAECAVVGIADDEWGQRVAAVVILRPGETLALDALRAWAKERLAPYKVPTLLRVVGDMPRNPMGKVMKPEVTRLF
ncbi:MAG TPA: acyl-CoA synthetase [Candidatus Dormibacteraeota bacterium]|nr:acyl-CoA synthetase [Candidatus Dormibacteraeota bacterium]